MADKFGHQKANYRDIARKAHYRDVGEEISARQLRKEDLKKSDSMSHSIARAQAQAKTQAKSTTNAKRKPSVRNNNKTHCRSDFGLFNTNLEIPTIPFVKERKQ